MTTAADESASFEKNPQRRWVIGLRLITSVFIFSSLLLLRFHGPAYTLSPRWFESGLVVIGIYILLAILHYRYSERPGSGVAGQILQIISDLALSICITLISGGGESPFISLFLIAIINSSFLGGIKLALTAATFSSALWGLIISFPNMGFLSEWFSFPLVVYEKAPFAANQAINILINTGACYLVAVLSGHLAGQIIQSRKALSQSQASLKRLSELNESIVKSIDAGLITTDTEGLILSVNPAGLDILGNTFEEVRGQPWHMFLPKLEEILSLPARHRFNFLGSASGLRFEYLRKDRRLLVLELDVMALIDKDNEIWGRLMVLKDFTSLSRMEAEVKKAEHLAALGEMAAGLAHEVRTPLASMTAAFHMLQNDLGNPEDQKRLMNLIGREMERLGSLSNDFLSFARPSRAQPQAFDLNKTIGEQLKVFKYSLPEGRRLLTKFQDLPPVYFDRDKFIQVIWNLLTNALEAGEKNEQLQISIESFEDPDRPQYALVMVSDNGPGIAPEVLNKIFEPFFSTKSRGGGLGLPTVSRLLHEGGGGISAISNPQDGTVFSVFLPLA